MIQEETIVINKMIPQSQEAIDGNREWHPRWIVQLVHGTPGESGVIVEEQYVTKKWERVEHLMLQYLEKSKTFPQHEHGEWYITVQEIVSVSVGDFTLPFIEEGRNTYESE